MGWAATLLAALTVIAGFTCQNVTIVYWTNSPISFYGILLICGLSFASIFGVALLAFAWLNNDLRALWPSDDPNECRLFAKPWRTSKQTGESRFTLTHSQVLFLVGFLNSLNGWLIVYASPSDRTPPLIQAVLQNAGVLFSVPFSKVLLGDRKSYLTRQPMIATGLILTSVAVSLAPSLMQSGSGGGFSSASNIAWCFIYLFGLAPGAGYNVVQQLYFLRTGMLEPDVPPKVVARNTLRALFWGNAAQGVSFLLCFWIDLIPWFGTSKDLSSFLSSTGFSLACSIGGPSLSSAWSSQTCTGNTPIWAWAFVGGYAFSYVGAAQLNRESATFNMLVLVVVTMTTAAFWLIPGTNPNPTSTPLWSVLTSLALSIIGSALWKRWENSTMPADEQFSVGPDALVYRGSMGLPLVHGGAGPSGHHSGKSFQGDIDDSYYSYGHLGDHDQLHYDGHNDDGYDDGFDGGVVSAGGPARGGGNGFVNVAKGQQQGGYAKVINQ